MTPVGQLYGFASCNAVVLSPGVTEDGQEKPKPAPGSPAGPGPWSELGEEGAWTPQEL